MPLRVGKAVQLVALGASLVGYTLSTCPPGRLILIHGRIQAGFGPSAPFSCIQPRLAVLQHASVAWSPM